MNTATAPNADQQVWIGMHTDKGIRVYSPASPRQFFMVGGDSQYPTCTCREFQEEEPGYRCPHILAVESQLPDPVTDDDGNPVRNLDREEQGDHNPPRQAAVSAPAGEIPAQMLMKRSVSPDGRIDSLSVEFSCVVAGLTGAAIADKARKTLLIQEEIVAGFKRNGSTKTQAQRPRANGRSRTNGSNGALPAMLVNVAGMDTKRGWSYFINVEANGETYKLFGNKRELGEHLVAAGYPKLARSISSGMKLNVPCQVTTSQNGKYTNVDQVLPPEEGNGNGNGASHDADIPF